MFAVPRAFSRARGVGQRLPQPVGSPARSTERSSAKKAESPRCQSQGKAYMSKQVPANDPAAKTKQVRLERTYDASIEDVWELWTTKEGIEWWGGPGGFAVPVRKLDLQLLRFGRRIVGRDLL